MEAADLELIEKYRKTNYELDRLYREHKRLADEIERIDSGKGLGPDEQGRLHTLKKNKLHGRDEIEAILTTLR
ncbi:MAG: YdcH family protein [Proteobacteria bacterium]|nr:YdcH family protein [Pseudomonadota bacterium]